MADIVDKVVSNSNSSNVKKILLVIIVILFIILVINMIPLFGHYTNEIDHLTNQEDEANEAGEAGETEETGEKEEKEETDDSEKAEQIIKNIKLSPNKLNITLFFVDWCGHSQQFKKKSWIKLLEKYNNDSTVELHELNCTNIKSTIKTPGGNTILGFPTIIFNYIDSNQKLVEKNYKGSREFNTINKFITNMSKNIEHVE